MLNTVPNPFGLDEDNPEFHRDAVSVLQRISLLVQNENALIPSEEKKEIVTAVGILLQGYSGQHILRRKNPVFVVNMSGSSDK